MLPDASHSDILNSQNDLNLTGKVAIVTGSSRGIGRAIALRLAQAGARLVLTARTEAALTDTAEVVRRHGSEARSVATPEGNANDVVSAAMDAFGRIDILVNNAGSTKHGHFLSLTDDDWTDGYATKFFSAVRLCRAAWPQLKRQVGSVVNIAGAGGRTPYAQFTIGASVNTAVLSFTKALAQLGIDDGVQVNAINPGPIRTRRLKQRIEDASKEWGVDLWQAEKRLLAELKIVRFGEPEEIAALVAFIVSPPGRLFQGALIDADAGYTKGL